MEAELPKNPCDQEVKAALDLGAINEAVNVARIHRLSVLCAGAITHCGDDSIYHCFLITDSAMLGKG